MPPHGDGTEPEAQWSPTGSGHQPESHPGEEQKAGGSFYLPRTQWTGMFILGRKNKE